MRRRVAKEGALMSEILIRTDENLAVQMHREPGPFEHPIWLVDQCRARYRGQDRKAISNGISVIEFPALLRIATEEN
jgi:hypothetical protein